ncbi:putative cox2 cytochrome oxidase subunit 2, partial [hydrothermal vent metagenome]
KLDNTQIGFKIEGVKGGVGFSVNYLTYLSQLPSLRGGSAGPAALNNFTGEVAQFPYLIAFDIEFPRIHLFGASTDFYVDSIKSVFRVEAAFTSGEEFANTLRPELYSESNVLRYVIGWDRDTFIPFLNKNKAFLFSAQLFGQHILDHELVDTPGSLAGLPGFTKAGIPDWKDNWTMTFLVKGWYMQNRLSPQIISAYDFRAGTAVIAPSIDWLIDDSWRLILGANFKFGKGPRKFDDCRSCNPWGPFTATPLHTDPFQAGSVGLGGFEPLGRFRSGPIGMASREDEIQLTLRYRF